MNINAFLLVIFATIIVAIAGYICFTKTFEDPIHKNERLAEKLFSVETLPDRRVVMMTVYKHKQLIGKCVIPYAFLSEEEKSGYRVGRIKFSNSKSLRNKFAYKLTNNKDLFYGVECPTGGMSGLSADQFRIHKLIHNNDYILALRATSAYGSGKGMYRVEDSMIVDSDNFYALVPSSFKTCSYKTENEVYEFAFECLNIYDSADYAKLEAYRDEVSKKRTVNKKRTSIVEKFFNDKTEPTTAKVYSPDSSDGPSYISRTDKTRPYLGREDTKVYNPKQHHQDYPKVL